MAESKTDEPQTSAFREDIEALKEFSSSIEKKWETRNDIYSWLPRGGVGVELGVFQGTNAKNLNDIARPSCLYLIDSWKSSGIIGDPSKPNKFQPRQDKRYKDVCRMFKRCSIPVHVWRAYTFEAVGSMLDESVDWIYIDASHRYENVLLDIHQWTPILKIGGYMMCHDFTTLIWKGGVIEAVKYALRRPGDLEIVGKDGERCTTVVMRKTRKAS